MTNILVLIVLAAIVLSVVLFWVSR